MEDNIYTKINRKKRAKKGTIPFFMVYTGMCDKNHKMFNHANDIKPITPSEEPEPTPAKTSSEVSGEVSGEVGGETSGESISVGVGESLTNNTEYDDEISDYFKVNDQTSDQNINEDIDNNLNDLVSFIQKIDFDSVNDDISKEFGDWELEVWKDIVSWNSWWKSECLFIQIDNDKLNRHLHYGDIENQDELDYKKEKLLKRLLNQNNN